MDQLGLNAIVLDSKHRFYNTPVELERWRLVEIRLANALSAMLKNSIPPAHSGLRIQIQCVEQNIADKHDSVISGRQLIRLMMDHFESSTALTSKFSYEAISALRWKGDSAHNITLFYWEYKALMFGLPYKLPRQFVAQMLHVQMEQSKKLEMELTLLMHKIREEKRSPPVPQTEGVGGDSC